MSSRYTRFVPSAINDPAKCIHEVKLGQGNFCPHCQGPEPTSSHTESTLEKRVPCHEDVGFGFRCLREKGHAGFHTQDPKRLLGEDPVTDDEVTKP